VPAVSYIWSASARSTGGASNTTNDYTLPPATLDPSRWLVAVVSANAGAATFSPDTFSGLSGSAVFSSDSLFGSSVPFTYPYGPGFGGVYSTLVLGEGVQFFFAYYPIPNFASGYVRITTSQAVNQVQALYLLGNVTAFYGTERDQNIFTNPFGWEGYSFSSGLPVPSTGIGIAAGVIHAANSLTTSATWGQQEIANLTSAGGVAGGGGIGVEEMVGAFSYTLPPAVGSSFYTGLDYNTGAQWTAGDFSKIKYAVGWAFRTANLPPLVRRGRAYAQTIG
jgi:hypothetical protein